MAMNILIDENQVKEISERKGYYVSSNGRVFKIKEMTVSILASGYASIPINEKNFSIHRLVMETFMGKSKLQVNHKNFIKDDNRLENLEFVTAKENMEWNAKHGRMPSGENNTASKLDWASALTVFTLYPHKMDSDLSSHYGLCKEFVPNLIRTKSWASLGIPFPEKIDKRSKVFRNYVGRKDRVLNN
jgi:hypothetical protein